MPSYKTSGYVNANDKHQSGYRDGNEENFQLNNNKMTIEQMVDYIQADLTFSGVMPKVLPDPEIMRLVKEDALPYFYKHYQWAVIKGYYKLDMDFINSEQYTNYGYLVMPEECENIVKISNISDPSMFRIGVQAPNLSINFGVTNQPYLTSFVTNVGELSVYRQILSAFSDEVNKLAKNYNKFSYNPESKRLHLLGEVRNDLMLEVYIRIQQEELFNSELFKEYVSATSLSRMGSMIGRLNFQMPGNFQYSASDMIAEGKERLLACKERIDKQSPNTSFFIMAK